LATLRVTLPMDWRCVLGHPNNEYRNTLRLAWESIHNANRLLRKYIASKEYDDVSPEFRNVLDWVQDAHFYLTDAMVLTGEEEGEQP
jgi:predicted AlkP superfamily phosphohydrolase/phosphomutase